MHALIFAFGSATLLLASVVNTVEGGPGCDTSQAINTFLLVILNVIATRNANTVRHIRKRVSSVAPDEGETVQRTRFTDENGDEHVVVHRYLAKDDQ